MIYLFLFYPYDYLPADMYCTMHMQYHQTPEGGVRSPGTVLTYGCGFWESNPGPLKEESALLATDPFSPAPRQSFLHYGSQPHMGLDAWICGCENLTVKGSWTCPDRKLAQKPGHDGAEVFPAAVDKWLTRLPNSLTSEHWTQVLLTAHAVP